MHSSRMRTGRSLSVCCSLLPGGGAWSGGVCLFQGGLPVLGGICSWGGVCSGGRVPGPGGCVRSGGVSQHALRQTPPPPHVDRHTLVKTLHWPNFVAAGNNNAFQWHAYRPLFTVWGFSLIETPLNRTETSPTLDRDPHLDRDPPGQRAPWTETPP